MARKNRITLKIIRILYLVLYTPLSVHYFFSSPPATPPPKIRDNSLLTHTVHIPPSSYTDKITKGINGYNKNIIVAASIGLAVTVFTCIFFNKLSKNGQQDSSSTLEHTANTDNNNKTKQEKTPINPLNKDNLANLDYKHNDDDTIINLAHSSDQQQADHLPLTTGPANLQTAIGLPPQRDINTQEEHNDNNKTISSIHANRPSDSQGHLASDSPQPANHDSSPLLNNSNDQQPKQSASHTDNLDNPLTQQGTANRSDGPKDEQQLQIATSNIFHNRDEENNTDHTSQNKKPIDGGYHQCSENTVMDNDDEKSEMLEDAAITPCIVPLGDHPQENFTHMCNVLAKMIKGETLAKYNQITPPDIEMFKQLSTGKSRLSKSIKDQWNTFRNSKKTIIIDMQYMNKDYQALKAAFVLNNPQNLLQFNKLLSIFPNVIAIICQETDNITGENDGNSYSPYIVNEMFIEGLYKMAKKNHWPHALKIIIRTKNNEINTSLKEGKFNSKGWFIERASYKTYDNKKYEHKQITLIKQQSQPPPPANSQQAQSQEESCLLM